MKKIFKNNETEKDTTKKLKKKIKKILKDKFNNN